MFPFPFIPSPFVFHLLNLQRQTRLVLCTRALAYLRTCFRFSFILSPPLRHALV